MDIDQLKDNIREALKQLETLGDSDPALPGLLKSLDLDLRGALDEYEKDHEESGPGEHLREIAVAFAARHPRLEPVLEHLMNMLSNIGI